MITVALDLICLVLMLYFASGAWSALGRRRRLLTERDFQKAEQWRAESEGTLPHEDPLLVSLDMALRDELGAEPLNADEERLPSEDQKA